MSEVRLDSRYPDIKTTFKPIDETSGVLLSTGYFTRVTKSDKEGNIKSVDFEGGPMLSVGDTFLGKTIEKIQHSYYVELK